MARVNSGHIVQFEWDGGIQKGLVIRRDQPPSLVQKKLRIVKLINDDFSDKVEPMTGKVLIRIISIDKLKVIGFYD